MELRGITPVIALVMLLLITVSIVGMSYAWFSGVLSASTKKSIMIPAGGAYCEGGDVKVYVLNSGDSAITAGDIIVANVDGVDVKNTPFFGDMKTGLAGYWKFDEGAGAVAADSSGNGNNGNLLPSCPNCPARTLGKSRNALLFDGVNDSVSVSNSASLGFERTSPLTISYWANAKNGNMGNAILTKLNELAGAKGIRLMYSLGNTNLTFLITDNHVVTDISITVNGITTNAWHHVAFTYDGNGVTNGMNGYLDGVLVASGGGGSLSSTTVNALPLSIGSNSDGQRFFNGTIDEVKIFNKTVGDVNILPGNSGLVINYPGAEGRHTVRIGTSSGAAETTVACA